MNFWQGLLTNVHTNCPLVHFITNYVTVNDCANITLACGGSPIMADEINEVEQISSLCSALVINIGTANERTLTAMIRAGRHANNLEIPIILDPTGAGASEFRNQAVTMLLREIDFTLIKGNISEIKFLSSGITSAQGVDAAATDLVNENNIEEVLLFAKKLAVMTGSIITITGPIDIIADNTTGYSLHNGHPLMTKVTGTGCMSGALLGCLLGANPQNQLGAAVTATAIMGISGELAQAKLRQSGYGTGNYRNFIIDEVSQLTEEIITKYIKLQRLD